MTGLQPTSTAQRPRGARTYSIRRWLVSWLLFGIVVFSAIVGLAIFRTTQKEAGELFDYELRTVALSLPHAVSNTNADVAPIQNFGEISDDLITVQAWNTHGTPILREPADAPLPKQPAGLRTVDYRDQRWRVFAVEQSDRFVQVAQPVEVRDELALRLAARTLWPLAILLPGAMVLVLVVVGRGLRPAAALSVQLAARSADSLDPVELRSAVPVELRPLVDALNDLLMRLDVALAQQRTFIADAAHELRSPLTALKLQLQVGVREGSVHGDPATLGRLEARLNRTIHLVAQLLALAREDAAEITPMKPFDVHALAVRVLTDASIVAEERHIDIGIDTPSVAPDGTPWTVAGNEDALRLLLDNLVDNAIRYTQPHGRIDIRLGRDEAGIWIEVVDNGPGIPELELERVFDRFYRGSETAEQGSGLGLAIARQVASRHRAVLALANNAGRRGLTARVTGLGIP
ncbi:ATP-binding protein [Pararobbsia silviterrae]|uniref:histidine kinase n=1 Tax=Pararobbsia silviterrae TaxID=1792498 RepID=A0A494XGF9_9BURK|nr:ATP-binding protein [Pararobbsia silviterrae]RKP49608.1 two-component sensor histidine kinase [Pararobbsia silviterrae]